MKITHLRICSYIILSVLCSQSECRFNNADMHGAWCVLQLRGTYLHLAGMVVRMRSQLL